MATQVIMPKLSPTMEEGQLSRWLKKEGDKVSMGEPLAEIDTDKATMEMQALGNGVLRKIMIKEGESAPLGQLIAIIGEPDEDISAMLAGAGSGAAPKEAAAQPEAKPEQGQTTAPVALAEPSATPKPAGAPAKTAASDGNGSAPAPAAASSERLDRLTTRGADGGEAGVDLRTLTRQWARRPNRKAGT